MTEPSVIHSTFVIERTYRASPQRVFAAWAEPEAKARWFAGGDGWESDHYRLDFRVGGDESWAGHMGEGPTIRYDSRYQDIIADKRIVYSYTMHVGEDRISVSLATAELRPSGDGTLLVYTEQGAYLDGHDTPEQREQGSQELFDALGEEVDGDDAGS